MRGFRLSKTGAVLLAALVVSVLVAIFVDGLWVPAAVVAGLVLFLMVADGGFDRETGNPGGTSDWRSTTTADPGHGGARAS
jgi:hypothetical protein